MWFRRISICITVLFVVTVILLHEFFQPEPDPEFYIENLNPLQSKSLDNVVEMNKLIISLALLVIGACAGILVQKYSNIKVKRRITIITLLFCILFAASSIFSGYVLYDNLVVMLSNGFYNPANQLIKWPQRLQFYSFFISVVLFGLFIVSSLINNDTEEKSDDKPLLVKIINSNPF